MFVYTIKFFLEKVFQNLNNKCSGILNMKTTQTKHNNVSTLKTITRYPIGILSFEHI